VKTVVGFDGTIDYDSTKPDGTPRKLLDTSLLSRMGWQARTELAEGLKAAYRGFMESRETA